MTIGDAARDAMPLLVRGRVLDAVRQAQAEAQGPATAAEVLVKLGDPPLARSPRALTALLHRVAATGADELGRRLAGDVDRLSVWRWVVEGGDPRDVEIAKRATALAAPGEDLHSVLLRALDALERSSPTPLTHKLPLEHPDAREGRFGSDGSDIIVSSSSGAPARPRRAAPIDFNKFTSNGEDCEVRGTPATEPTAPIQADPVPEPDPTANTTAPIVEPQPEGSPAIGSEPDSDSAATPAAPPPSAAPAGPLYAALANVRAMRGSK